MNREVCNPQYENAHADAVVIVGAGIAGLLAAHEVATHTDRQVTVLEKPVPQSNTLIAGQRFRAGIPGVRRDGQAEIEQLFALRNNGEVTPRMAQFAEVATRELEYWQSQPGHEATDAKAWFGPQWGTKSRAEQNRGRSILNRLSNQCLERGVQFMTADVHELTLGDSGRVASLGVSLPSGRDARLTAGNFVLASGSAGGYIFDSTNRPIRQSSHELAFQAGLPLEGATTHFFHPFARMNKQQQPVIGCHETDNLAEAQVVLRDHTGAQHIETTITELLQNHQAHEHFPAIVQKFRQYGSVALLQFPDGAERYTRVAHHQTQLGIITTDGVSVEGVDNLYAIGDASSINYWTNHAQRLPGFALTKCLVDARLLSEQVAQSSHEPAALHITDAPGQPGLHDRASEQRLRRLNATFLNLYDTHAGDASEQQRIAVEWMQSLNDNTATSVRAQHQLSTAVARAHHQAARGVQRSVIRIQQEDNQKGEVWQTI